MSQSTTSKVRIDVGTESYEFDRDALTLTDLFAIKSASGLDFNPFLQGMNDANPTALQVLVWFCRHKAGIQGDPLQVDFKIGDLNITPIDEPDPTGASSSDVVATISEDSPTTST